MKIGEFAKICGTKISVLRHYDSQGLLKPDYVDRLTGYRFYSAGQTEVFHRITALKKAGFSLAEIGEMLKDMDSGEDTESFFEKKRIQLERMLQNLQQARSYLSGGYRVMDKITFERTDNGLTAKGTFGNNFAEMDRELSANDYQRISPYSVDGDEIQCQVIKLDEQAILLNEDTSLPFVNDEKVIGRWKVAGEYAVKQDFYNGIESQEKYFSETTDSIYFLPDGERYWCYGWTKEKLIIETGNESFANEYETEVIDGVMYMFVSLRSYYCRRGGQPTTLVLKKLDSNHYTAKEIARKDNIDMPFENDKRVLGKWRVYDFTNDKKDWHPRNKNDDTPSYFESVEFRSDGECISVYGGEVISGEDMQVWTKGYILRKWNSTACAYEIREIDGVEYLIIEWKSGDYRWGGFDTDYYVFVRA